MKKIFYFLFFLFITSNALAEKLYLKDIKLNEKLTDYLSTEEISNFNINGTGELKDAYSYDGKYSIINVFFDDQIFFDDYDYIQIVYSNKDNKIKFISAALDYRFDNTSGKKQCLNYRDKRISEYNKEKLLFEFKKNYTNYTYPDGVKEDRVEFTNPIKRSSFSFYCLYYENNDNDFRFDYIDTNFWKWYSKQWEKTY